MRRKGKGFSVSNLIECARIMENNIFGDETKIEMENNNKSYVWSKINDRLRPGCNDRPLSRE